MSSSPATRVVVADDDVLLREGLASLLVRSGFDVVAQAGDGVTAIRACREHEPDLLLIDIRMPPTHSTEGLEAAHAIREEYPDMGVLVLSAYVEVEHAMDLLASGQRSGYLLKSRVTDVDDFLETLERVVKGGSVVDPALVQQLVAARRVDDPLAELTPREREVLALMAEGRSNSDIWEHLVLSPRTVEAHVGHVFLKLGLSESAEGHRRVLNVRTYLRAQEGEPAV